MSVHLQREMDRLKKELLGLCAIVEEQVHLAVQAVVDRDAELAARVEQRDAEIDRREVEIEEHCLSVLALHQPVAIDLRWIVAVLKINNDLERIGDLAVNVARKAAAISNESSVEVPFDLERMGEMVESMLRDSLDAMVRLDAAAAQDVCRRDDEVDRIKHEARREIEERVCREPQRAKPLLRLLAVSRNLERVADCATNIAEDVIYITEGRIMRHREGE